MPHIKSVSGALAVVDLSEIPEDRIEELRLRTGLTVAFLEPGPYRLHRTPGGFEVNRDSRLVRVKRGALRAAVLATVGLVGVGVYRLPDTEAARTEYIATTGERIVVKGREVEEVDPGTTPIADHAVEAPVHAERPHVADLIAPPAHIVTPAHHVVEAHTPAPVPTATRLAVAATVAHAVATPAPAPTPEPAPTEGIYVRLSLPK